MADNNLEILIVQAMLDKTVSTTNIKKDLIEISKMIGSLKLSVNIDTTDLTKLAQQVEVVTKQMQSKKIAVIDKNSIADGQKLYATMQQVVDEYSKLGKIKITNESLNPLTKDVQSFTLSVENADKKVEKLKFDLMSISDGASINKMFTPTKLNQVNPIESNNKQMLNEAYKMNDDFNKKAEALDKAHYQALKTNQERIEAQDKMHYMALKQNRDIDLRSQETFQKQAEAIDKAHYQALKTNQEKIDALDKQHYIALQKNAEFDNKQDIANKKLGTNVGAAPKFGLNFQEAQDYAKSLTGVDSQLKNIGYSFNSAGEKLQTLNIRTKEGGKYHKEYTATLNEATGQTHLFEKGLSDVSNRQLSVAEKFKTMAQSIPLWMVGMTAFMSTLHFFTEGVKYVNELNATLTQISTAVNYNQEKVASLGKTYQTLAVQMGATTKEVAAGALEFYRQGLGDDEVNKRLELTTKYAKISGLEFKQSAELLTAASTSTHTEITKVADVFTLLGDKTATSASEIAIGFQKVGATADSLHVPFEKVAAIVATISSVTREAPEAIGSAVKSILSRVESVKQKGYDSEDGTTINQVAKALDAAKVKLVDANGQFRNFSTVLDELGARWTSLDDKTQRYVATTVAGTYQQSRFLALMSNYGRVLDLNNEALNAAGTTQLKYNLYLEGTKAHIDRLKAVMEGLWSNTFSSNGIKTVVDSLTGLLTGVDSIVKNFGFLPPVIFAASTALLFFNTRIKELSTQGWVGAFSSLIAGFRGATGSVIAFDVAAVAARLSTIALQATLSLGLSLAITAVVEGITLLIGKQQELDAQQKVFDNQQKTIANNWVNQKDKITSLLTEYSKLLGINSKSADEEQKYLKVQTDISALLPNLTKNIDEKGQAHLKSSEAIAKELENTEKLAKAEQNRQLVSSADTFKDLQKQRDALLDSHDQVQNQLTNKTTTGLASNPASFLLDSKLTDAELGALEVRALGLQSQIADANGKIKDAILTLTTSAVGLAGVKVSDSLNKELQSVVNTLKLDDLKPEELTAKVVALSTLIQKLNDIKNLRSGNAIDSVGSLEKENQEFINLAHAVGMTDEQIKKISDSMFGFKKTTQDTTFDVDALQKKLTSAYEATATAVRPLNDAIDKMQQGHALSSSEISGLLKKYPDLISAFTDENGMLKINVAALIEKRDAEIEGMNVSLTADQNALASQETALIAKLSMYGVEIDAINSVADAKKAVADLRTYDDGHGSKASEIDIAGAESALLPQLTAIGKAKEAMKALQDATKNGFRFQDSTNTPNPKKPKQDSQASLHVPIDFMNEEIHAINEVIKTRDQNIASINKQIETAKKTESYNDIIQKTNELITEQKSKIDDITSANDLLSNSADGVRDKFSTLGTTFAELNDQGQMVGFDKWFNPQGDATQNYVSAIQEIEASIKNIQGDGKNLTNEQSNQVTKLESQIKLYQDIFKQLQQIKKAYTSNSDEQKKINDLIESSANAMVDAKFNDSKRWIDEQKALTKLSLDDELAAWKRVVANHMDDETQLQSVRAENATKRIAAEKEIARVKQELMKQDDADHAKFVSNTNKLADDTIKAYKKGFEELNKAEDERHSKEMKNLDEKEKKFNSIVDDQLKANDRLLATQTYTEDLTSKEKDRADLLSKQKLLDLSDDVASKDEKQKIAKDLEKLDDDIAKLKRTRDRDMVKQGLQDVKESYKKEIDASKEKENAQHDAAHDKYAAILNDEQKFAQMRDEIFAGETKNITSDFASLTTSLQDNSKLMGDALVTNLTNNLVEIQKKIKSTSDSIKAMKPETIGGNRTGDERKDYLDKNPDQKKVAYPEVNKDTEDWQLKLDQAAKDDAYARSEITRAKSVYEADKAKGDMVGAEAAHRWADQLRAANPRVGADPLYMNTGGYTGDGQGLAYLHSKELILNSIDTSNILKAVDFTRSFMSNIKMPDFSSIINKNHINAGETKVFQIQGNLINVDKIDANTNIENILERAINKMESLTGTRIRTN